LFSRVKNNNVSKQKYKIGSPYTLSTNMPRRLNIVPVKDLRTIELGWPTHSTEALYRIKPAGYCSHMIGHEGPGSLFALLKKEGLADALSCGMFQNNDGFGMFAISVDATDEGMKRVEDVVNYCYQYISMFRAAGSPEWIFKESQLIADNSFRFKEKRSPSSYVSSIASNMKTYSPEDTLCGGSLYQEFAPNEIKKIMDCLVPSNMRLQCTSRSYDGTTELEEKWYKTKYSNLEIAPELLKEWSNPTTCDARLHLPQPNELIAKEFQLRCTMNGGNGITGIVEGPPPPCVNIHETDIHTIWHKEDSEFGVPKCVVYINLMNPMAYDSPRSTVLSALYSDVVKDALNEYSYDASIAGLQYELINSTKGLQLVFFGYNDVMPTLLVGYKNLSFLLNPKTHTTAIEHLLTFSFFCSIIFFIYIFLIVIFNFSFSCSIIFFIFIFLIVLYFVVLFCSCSLGNIYINTMAPHSTYTFRADKSRLNDDDDSKRYY